MIKELDRRRDEQVTVQDEQARILLFELGILDQFKLKDYGRAVTQAVIFSLPTHHILALHHSGHADQEENGYQAFCLPKSQMTADTFDGFVTRMLEATPEDALEIRRIAPNTNN